MKTKTEKDALESRQSLSTLSAKKDYIRFLGRCYEIDECVHFDWSSSGFEFSFTGTKAEARLGMNHRQPGKQNDAYVQVYVDEKEVQIIRLDNDNMDSWFVLADGLTTGVHTVEVRKITEAASSGCRLTDCRVDGAFEPKPAGKKRRIEFIGDSITCGLGITSTDPSDEFTTEQENSMLTWASLAARYFDADWNSVAISGCGVVQDASGQKNLVMPQFYEKTQGLSDICKTDWDFGSWQPDAVVINLGSNDFGSYVEKEAFHKEAVKFLKMVRSKNPKSRIFWVYGMMIDARVEEIEEAIEAYCRLGDNDATFIRLPLQDMAQDGTGAGNHPNIKTNEKAAEWLIQNLKTHMQW